MSDLANFVDQFFFSANSTVVPDGWQSKSILGWTLATHPSLPIVELRTSDGSLAGWLIGFAIDREEFVHDTLQLQFSIEDESTASRFESVIYSFGGRYACFLLTPITSRLYLDAGGTLAAVFSPERKSLASTTSILLTSEKEHVLFAKSINEFPSDRPDQFYPAGLTATKEISRLLPNHYLDLNTWQVFRHHPKAIDRISDNGVSDLVDEIVSTTQANIRAVARASRSFYLGLTAGRDTRMLLACAKAVVDQAHFVTFDYRQLGEHRGYRLDVWTAMRLSRQLRLNHIVLPVEPVSASVCKEYLLRIGYAGGHGKARDFYFACEQNLDLSTPWVTGFAAEVGRAYYWNAVTEENSVMNADYLLCRMGLPPSPRFCGAMEDWLARLPAECDQHLCLDLAYLEHRLGCWASPHLYGAAGFRMNLTPFCHRRIFDSMLRLPVTYRGRQRLADDIIRAAWPELGRLPYNDWTGVRLMIARLKRKVQTVLRLLSPDRSK